MAQPIGGAWNQRDPEDPAEQGSDQEQVYADWSSFRLLGPVILLVGVVSIAGLLLFRSVVGGEQIAVSDSTVPAANSGTEVDSFDPRSAADQFVLRVAAALQNDDLASVPFAFRTPGEASAEVVALTEDLGPYRWTVQPGAVEITDEVRATVPLKIAWTLEDGTTFDTSGELDLVLVGSEWQVDWDVGAVEATLLPADRLSYERATAPRAPILDRNGFGLVDQRPVIEVALVPRDSPDPGAVAGQVASLFQLDGAEIADQVRRSPSDERFVVTVQRAEVVEPHRAQLASLPGVKLDESTRALTPSDRFARSLLGRTGEVTAEILERSPDYFEEGDIVGRSGLQALYNEQLAGLAGRQVRIIRRFPLPPAPVEPTEPDPADAESEDPEDPEDPEAPEPALAAEPPPDPNILFLEPPTGAAPLQTTLDRFLQEAAEQALAASPVVNGDSGEKRPGALVALQASTGEVLAVANGPGAASEDRALTGSYAPGSIFKIVTAYGGLVSGFSADSKIECPKQIEVDGREFRNHDGGGGGELQLRRAFAQSCNTSFVLVGESFEGSAFPSLARQFGIGDAYQLGTASFGGSVPNPQGATERAATAFGQANVVMSPLAGAVMAATAASGTYNPPSLVVEADRPANGGAALDGDAAWQLREMMRLVVTDGTGRALRGVPGGDVFGKTGTAEYGSDSPPRTHAWFVGFQNDLAFAVLVEDGGSGGSVAAPIAADFLTRVAQGGGE